MDEHLTDHAMNRRNDVDDSLVIVIRNEQPVFALDLGEVLTALAVDFRKFSGGRTLVVHRIDHGSIELILTAASLAVSSTIIAAEPIGKAAMGVVKAAKGIKDFTLRLKELFNRGDRGVGQMKTKSTKAGPASIEKIYKLASTSRSNVYFYYKSETEEIEFKIEPDVLPVSERSVDA